MKQQGYYFAALECAVEVGFEVDSEEIVRLVELHLAEPAAVALVAVAAAVADLLGSVDP